MKIDEYAQSMFRFEQINAAWVTRCARYLTHVFGKAIQGATVVDYAFGRGNWSLAFLEAGANKIIAIDAAVSNVVRFSTYIKKHGIRGIEVITGNVLDRPIEAQADIIWIYGILHHIDAPQQFMRALTSMWGTAGQGLGLVYAYNQFSLRQVVVSLARRGLIYGSYAAFLDDSLLFSHSTRLRVRDDLTAPYISWYSQDTLQKLVLDAGAIPVQYVDSFAGFEKNANAEFTPHHLLISRTGAANMLETKVTLGLDEYLVNEFGEVIFTSATAATLKKLAVGLMNTHFGALSHGGYETALVKDFLFLLYAFETLELSAQSALQQSVLELAHQSLKGRTGGVLSEMLQRSVIAAHLDANPIRI